MKISRMILTVMAIAGLGWLIGAPGNPALAQDVYQRCIKACVTGPHKKCIAGLTRNDQIPECNRQLTVCQRKCRDR